MWPFTLRRSTRDSLLASYEDAALKRRSIEAELEGKRLELEKHRIDQEMEHIAALGEERRKEREHRAKMREEAQNRAAHARDVYRRKQSDGQNGTIRADCDVCNHRTSLTTPAEMVLDHSMGHTGQAFNWKQ